MANFMTCTFVIHQSFELLYLESHKQLFYDANAPDEETLHILQVTRSGERVGHEIGHTFADIFLRGQVFFYWSEASAPKSVKVFLKYSVYVEMIFIVWRSNLRTQIIQEIHISKITITQKLNSSK